MTMAQRKKEQKILMDDLLTRNWNVFGTLKFANGRTIGRYTADKLLHCYWNKIDLTFFGKAAERQDRSTLEQMAQYEHDQQQARIKKAASPLWLRHAQKALEAQQAAYEADDGNLVSKRG